MPRPDISAPESTAITVTVHHSLGRQVLTEVLFGADIYCSDRASALAIRSAVRDRLTADGVKGCRRAYDRARRAAEQQAAAEPTETINAMTVHNQRLIWCLKQIDKAFRPRRRRMRPSRGQPLLDVLAHDRQNTSWTETRP